MSKKKSYSKYAKPYKGPEVEEYNYHLPVFFEKSVDYLINNVYGTYIDGTLGGGGHSSLILKKLGSGGNLIAFDKDLNAIEHCRIRFADELAKTPSRLTLVNECYSGACSINDERNEISGLLLDLGVSSMQLDTDSCGLSYRVNSQLDMRFGLSGVSAEDLLNSSSEDELESILRTFGEEPFARVIARRIVQRRRASTLKTTFELRMIVEECVPEPVKFKALSRVFQAVRIAVNRELDVLEDTLHGIIPMLAPGGRIVILSYHSLEDRIVKQIFKEYEAPKKKYKNDLSEPNPKACLNILTPKPIVPDEEEIHRNPRARSAKLRVAEKV